MSLFPSGGGGGVGGKATVFPNCGKVFVREDRTVHNASNSLLLHVDQFEFASSVLLYMYIIQFMYMCA